MSVIECLTNHSYGKADGVFLEPLGVRSGPFPGHISVMRAKKKRSVTVAGSVPNNTLNWA